MNVVVGILSKRIELGSPCGKCREYYKDIEGSLEDFLETGYVSHLHELKKVSTSIDRTRKELGQELLNAISDGCKTCRDLGILLNPNFLNSLNGYANVARELEEGDFDEVDFIKLVGDCGRELFYLKKSSRDKKRMAEKADRIF